ncbi:MAG: peptidyl-prolyl cis-trans isomerase [Planctomycetes bacterium]|nr:peptidyl-prolyl cis-trans isomerase [Planctomycetota bacterium]
MRPGRVLLNIAAAGLIVVSGSGAADPVPAAAGPSLTPEELKELTFLSPGIVAKVNDEIITSDDLRKYLEFELQVLKKSAPAHEQYLNKAFELYRSKLKSDIEDRVLLGAARDQGVVITDLDVDQAAKKEIQNVGTKEKLEALIAQQGHTWEEWYEDVRKTLIKKELILQRIGFKQSARPGEEMPLDSIPSPQMLREYYEKHRSDFYRGRQVQVAQIILSFTAETREFTRALIESLRRQLVAGADFALLARFYSEDKAHADGVWPITSEESFHPKIREAVLALEVGELSTPLEADTTLRLVRMDGKIAPVQKPFDDPQVQKEISEAVQSALVQQNIERVRRNYMRRAFIWCRDAEMQAQIDRERDPDRDLPSGPESEDPQTNSGSTR